MNKYLLLGCPNVGKTTIFNNLTNSVATVGNYSGVTIEKKIGNISDNQGLLVDLPGIYSIVPSTIDEGITTRVLLEEDTQGIINTCDVSSLTRQLHLTIQLLEFGSPTAIILNFYDEFEKSGRTLNREVLEEVFGVKVLRVIATESIDNKSILSAVNSNVKSSFSMDYGVLEPYIKKIKSLLPHNKIKRNFLAISILEYNREVDRYLKSFPNYSEIIDVVEKCNDFLKLETNYKTSRVAIFDMRRIFIKELLEKASYSRMAVETLTESSTNKYDKYLTSPKTGIPVFIALLLTIYYFTFNLIGNKISDTLDVIFNEFFNEIVNNVLSTIGISGMLEDLIMNGIYAGTTSILIFLPQVVILFLFLTTLESVGYLSRVSILFDGLLEKVGLNGKSIIPLITGIGCNVPAIMGTRVIDSKKERLITIMTLPFISCSARIPIYVIFASAFFGKYAFIAMLFLQFFGVFIVLIVSKILSRSVFKNDSDYLVLEIPPYRKPQLSYILKISYNKGKSFVKNVTFFVAVGTVIVWFLSSFNLSGYNISESESFMSQISGVIAPIFTPLGFGNWQATSSLISGFMAKELVVSSMAIIYGVGDSGLESVLQSVFTLPSAISFVVFNALYVPCIATVGVIKKETNSWKWTMLSVSLSLVVAYVVALISYIIASLIF